LGIEAEVDIPVISGEWSLAMDTCAMWLLGFNDMQPGEPRAICDMVPCPCRGGKQSTMASCYLGESAHFSGVQTSQPGLPLDVGQGLQGPFGSGISGPMFGRCPREMALEDSEDEWITNLAHKQIAAFNQAHGWFFWNFRTEFESHWDFLESYRRGWFPRNVSDWEALDSLKVCDAGTPPLKPTTWQREDGIYASEKTQFAGTWLSRNWLPLVLGSVGGALMAMGVMRGIPFVKPAAAPRIEGAPYVAMLP